jgi:hypothetical protein
MRFARLYRGQTIIVVMRQNFHQRTNRSVEDGGILLVYEPTYSTRVDVRIVSVSPYGTWQECLTQARVTADTHCVIYSTGPTNSQSEKPDKQIKKKERRGRVSTTGVGAVSRSIVSSPSKNKALSMRDWVGVMNGA